MGASKSTKSPRVVAIVGMTGAGKSTCVEHLALKGIPSVYIGGVVVDETKRRHGGETNEAWEREVREEFRKKDGMGAIAKRTIPIIDKLLNDCSVVVADGIYSWTEYKMFKEHYGESVVIIAIATARHLRHERLERRPIRPISADEVTKREFSEIENIEKGGPIANADYTICNDGDPIQMLESLEQLLARLGVDFASFKSTNK